MTMASTSNRSLVKSTVGALAIAVLAVGCVDGGVRRMRLQSTPADGAIVADVMVEEVAPPFKCAASVSPLSCAAPAVAV